MAENRIWRCSECRSTYPKSKLLEAHSRHTKHKAYSCTKDASCGKSFRLRTALIRHEASHSEAKRHACQCCDKAFHRRDHCQEHETICRANRLLIRSMVDSIVSNPELDRIMEEVRAGSFLAGMSTSEARPRSESHDQTTVFSPADRPEHHERDRAHAEHRNIPDHTTAEGWPASEARELGSTLRIAGKSPLPDVSEHVQKLTAVFKCSYCDMHLTTLGLRSHLRKHTNPLACLICGKAFEHLSDCLTHEYLHMKEERFFCKGGLKTGDQWGCGRDFAAAHALVRHFLSEGGRICIKPLLDEEAQDGVYDDWDFLRSPSLLQQYPTLQICNKFLVCEIWDSHPNHSQELVCLL